MLILDYIYEGMEAFVINIEKCLIVMVIILLQNFPMFFQSLAVSNPLYQFNLRKANNS